MKFKNVWTLLLIIVLFSSACSTTEKLVVQNKTIYPSIPDGLLVPVEFIEVPESLTIAEGLSLAGQLRLQACTLAVLYRELLRHASGGEIVLDYPSENQCPHLSE